MSTREYQNIKQIQRQLIHHRTIKQFNIKVPVWISFFLWLLHTIITTIFQSIIKLWIYLCCSYLDFHKEIDKIGLSSFPRVIGILSGVKMNKKRSSRDEYSVEIFQRKKRNNKDKGHKNRHNKQLFDNRPRNYATSKEYNKYRKYDKPNVDHSLRYSNPSSIKKLYTNKSSNIKTVNNHKTSKHYNKKNWFSKSNFVKENQVNYKDLSLMDSRYCNRSRMQKLTHLKYSDSRVCYRDQPINTINKLSHSKILNSKKKQSNVTNKYIINKKQLNSSKNKRFTNIVSNSNKPSYYQSIEALDNINKCDKSQKLNMLNDRIPSQSNINEKNIPIGSTEHNLNSVILPNFDPQLSNTTFNRDIDKVKSISCFPKYENLRNPYKHNDVFHGLTETPNQSLKTINADSPVLNIFDEKSTIIHTNITITNKNTKNIQNRFITSDLSYNEKRCLNHCKAESESILNRSSKKIVLSKNINNQITLCSYEPENSERAIKSEISLDNYTKPGLSSIFSQTGLSKYNICEKEIIIFLSNSNAIPGIMNCFIFLNQLYTDSLLLDCYFGPIASLAYYLISQWSNYCITKSQNRRQSLLENVHRNHSTYYNISLQINQLCHIYACYHINETVKLRQKKVQNNNSWKSILYQISLNSIIENRELIKQLILIMESYNKLACKYFHSLVGHVFLNIIRPPLFMVYRNSIVHIYKPKNRYEVFHWIHLYIQSPGNDSIYSQLNMIQSCFSNINKLSSIKLFSVFRTHDLLNSLPYLKFFNNSKNLDFNYTQNKHTELEQLVYLIHRYCLLYPKTQRVNKIEDKNTFIKKEQIIKDHHCLVSSQSQIRTLSIGDNIACTETSIPRIKSLTSLTNQPKEDSTSTSESSDEEIVEASVYDSLSLLDPSFFYPIDDRREQCQVTNKLSRKVATGISYASVFASNTNYHIIYDIDPKIAIKLITLYESLPDLEISTIYLSLHYMMRLAGNFCEKDTPTVLGACLLLAYKFNDESSAPIRETENGWSWGLVTGVRSFFKNAFTQCYKKSALIDAICDSKLWYPVDDINSSNDCFNSSISKPTRAKILNAEFSVLALLEFRLGPLPGGLDKAKAFIDSQLLLLPKNERIKKTKH